MELFSKYVETDGRSNVAPTAGNVTCVELHVLVVRHCECTWLVGGRPVMFYGRSECIGQEKHLLPVPGN